MHFDLFDFSLISKHSVICFWTLWRGLSDVIGSWKIIEIFFPLIFTSLDSSNLSKFTSLKIQKNIKDDLALTFTGTLALSDFEGDSKSLLKSLNKKYLDKINNYNDEEIFDFLLMKFNNNHRNYKKSTCPKWDYILDNIVLQYKLICYNTL